MLDKEGDVTDHDGSALCTLQERCASLASVEIMLEFILNFISFAADA